MRTNLFAKRRSARVSRLIVTVLILISCFPPCLGAEDSEEQQDEEATTGSSRGSVSPFLDNEFLRPYFGNEECREFARRALVNWRNGEYGAAEVNCRQAGKLLRSRGKAWQALSEHARLLVQNHQRVKGLLMYIIAYEGCYETGQLTADGTKDVLFTIANLCNRRDSSPAESKLADKYYEHAVQISSMSHGLDERDASNVLMYAGNEISLHKWESARKLLEQWRRLFTVLGKEPPESQLPDALAQLGLCATAEGRGDLAEDYFRQAVEAAKSSSGGTITQVGHIDVGVLLIYALIDQDKMTEARNLARDHLAENEKQLGVSSIEIANLLNELADRFDRAGQIAFAAELRRRAKQRRVPAATK
ncbi:MAG: hypothetical protein K2Z81_09440 [Cyanobacteria bacterium]|nr:hypothetical protein [Cyanobacteriota bacterium]